MDILAAFLQMFAPRKICGACLARVTDEPVLPTEQRLEGMVRDRTLAADRARCLNCEGLARVYWHG